MTWLYLDDGFPEHPKVLKAGGDAAWLWVCGLGYANRRLTMGVIPREAVPTLSDRKKPLVLAQRLVDVELWDEHPDGFYIHDYEDMNRSAMDAALKRKAKASKAARARWEQCSSNAQALPKHMLGDALPQPQPQPVVRDTSPTTAGVGGGTGGEGLTSLGLANRLEAACKGRNRTKVRSEAGIVVDHLARFVDLRIIDQAIGYAESAEVVFPTWLFAAVRAQAPDVQIPQHPLEVKGASA